MKNPFGEEIYKKRKTQRDYGVRGDYFRDQTAIIHSMPFRRLKNKTQVFFAPKNDHVCTRIEHVLHVATIAATICKGLNQNNKDWNLDIDLAYAIGLGHDLGHAPFGHAGEETLNNILKEDDSFIHEINGYRVVEYVANNGKGLNLTYVVKDGIMCHNGESFEQNIQPSTKINKLDEIKDKKNKPCSYEGCIVRMADKIAYLGRDVEDAYVAGAIGKKNIPGPILRELGSTNGEIIDTLVEDIICNSKDKDFIGFSNEKFSFFKELMDFNYKYIYNNEIIVNYKKMCSKLIETLFNYLAELYDKNGYNIDKYLKSGIDVDRHFGNYVKKLESFYKEEGCGTKRIVTDYVSGMTDIYALDCMKQITIPKPIYFPN